MNELSVGLLCLALSFAAGRFAATPELILGFLTGIGLCYMILSIMPEKAYNTLKAWKEGLFRKGWKND